jgi:adenine/guanine/hypoxanthine permease
LFFSPLVRMIGGGYPAANNVVLYPIIAPALILVGVMMMEGVRAVRWDDYTEAIPAFLTLITMPLAVSITDGIAFGFISFAILKLATGRARELDWLGYVFAVLFLIRYSVG